MIIIQENSSRQKELVMVLTPLIRQYAKATASIKAILDLVDLFALVLDKWDYSPKEIRGLDKRAFLDLLKSWQIEATPKDLSMIKAVI